MRSPVKKNKNFQGFTLLELLVVLAIIAILSAIAVSFYSKSINKAYASRSDFELSLLEKGARMYYLEHGTWPPDVSRNIPSELMPYLTQSGNWPRAPWPGSVFDWDHWNINGEEIVQISIRFCPAGGPLSACQFPRESWAQNFDVNSAYYICLVGTCRAHSSEPVDYPAKCANCGN